MGVSAWAAGRLDGVTSLYKMLAFAEDEVEVKLCTSERNEAQGNNERKMHDCSEAEVNDLSEAYGGNLLPDVSPA